MTRGAGLCMLRAVPHTLSTLLCSLLVAAPFTGCSGGTETGNPSFQSELSYTAYSSAPRAVGVRSSAAELTVTHAWIDLDAVALVRSGTCATSSPDAVIVPALGIGDHAAGDHNLTRFELTPGAFCELDLPFVRAPRGALTGNVPAELAEHSVMLAGSLADGTTFSLLSSASPVVHLVAETGSFAINQGQAQTLITFDVATWLDGLDWDGATRRDGAIFISDTENAQVLAQFEARLASGVALYRDADGDGKLDTVPERLAHGE